MSILFQIETRSVLLNWQAAANKTWDVPGGLETICGKLCVSGRNDRFALQSIWRAEVPSGLVADKLASVGPRLFEQTDYRIFLRSHSGDQVELVHRDPSICNALAAADNGSLRFGTINFRADVGLSLFTVLVNGVPEFDFEVEVFPTKLDYKEDYERLIAETEDFISGLVFEYLRSTYRLSFPNLPRQSSRVEWLLLLRMVMGELELALNYIAHHPLRGMTRLVESTRTERIKRIDSFVRAAIHRGAGSGITTRITDSLSVRERIPARKADHTLNTPEHRWLAFQLQRIRENLLSLRTSEMQREKSDRRAKIIDELKALEQQILTLQKLEPIESSEGIPPAGFASLQLLTAPGYREAYRACMLLSMGLQIEGGPVNLSLKELSLLYEYWCYLSVIHLVSELTGEPIPIDEIVKTKRSGLEIQLEKGKESRVRFKTHTGRSIVVSYNRHVAGTAILTPQKPDIMITFEDSDWPAFSLLLDAKYRIKLDKEYVAQFGSPGPPIDAVNALHRYRDAILESKSALTAERPKRTVIQAAALFPYREKLPGSFRGSKLWQSIDTLGIGAIPMLPNSKEYLKEWLLTVLRHGGWAIADKAIGYQSEQRAQEWHVAAAEPVLIGVLKADISREHLDWIMEQQLYYMPLLKSQSRQLSAKWVAIYSPLSIRTPGAVTHRARVIDVEIKPRGDIDTPWSASQGKEELQVLYHLDRMAPLPMLIVNRHGDRFSSHRWASRLSLERAKTISELFLESEPEWRLYEELKAAKIQFTLEPTQPRSLSSGDPTWRTWFVTKLGKIRYAGPHGFLLRSPTGREEIFAQIDKIVAFLMTSAQE